MTTIGHAIPLMKRANRRVWLAKRRKVLGATDAVAVLGYSPWRTPFAVWAEKVGKDPGPDLDGQWNVERGKALERIILNHWAATHGAELVPFPPLLRHPDYAFIAASLDGVGRVNDELVVLEAKSVGWRSRSDWWDTETLVPDMYAVQVLMQLAVTGLARAYVVADVAGEYREVMIERDHEFEGKVLPYLFDWWRKHVIARTPPALDVVADYSLLNKVWVPEPELSITADRVLLNRIAEYRMHQAVKAEADTELKRLRGTIRAAMQNASVIHSPEGEKLASISKNGSLTITRPTLETSLQERGHNE